jgi:hypothetical protein
VGTFGIGAFRKDKTEFMAKTTRKTEAPGSVPTARPVRRKTTAGASTARAAAAAPKAPRKRAASPARSTRKSSTSSAAAASADDRKAVGLRPAPGVEPTHDEIATRAYHIYLRRNGWPGNPDHDWLQAIDELRSERMIAR